MQVRRLMNYSLTLQAGNVIRWFGHSKKVSSTKSRGLENGL